MTRPTRPRRGTLALLALAALCTLLAAPAAAAPPPVAEAAARGAAPAPPATLTAVPAVRAADVAASTGWNTHWNYYDRVYARYDELRPLVDDLGVTLMRDGLPLNDDLMRKYRELCATGVRFVMSTDNADHLARLPGVVRELGPECVAGIAGNNEPDLFWGLHGIAEADWPRWTREHQIALWKVVQGDPVLRDIPVLSMSPTGQSERLGDLSAYFDYCDVHPYGSYQGYTVGGYADVYRAYAEDRWQHCGDKPMVATETGFHDAPNRTNHVGKTERAIELMLPKQVAYLWNAGFVLHANYELVDEGTDPLEQEDNFGVIQNDLSVEPAYAAMRELQGLLADDGGGPAPGALTYAVEGERDRVQTLLTQRADGTFVLLLQSDEPVFDEAAFADVVPPVKDVTVRFDGERTVRVHRIGGDEGADEVRGSAVPLQLGAELLVLEIAPDGAAPAPAPAPAPGPAPAPAPTAPPTTAPGAPPAAPPAPEPAPEAPQPPVLAGWWQRLTAWWQDLLAMLG